MKKLIYNICIFPIVLFQFLSQRTNTKTKVLNLSQDIPEIEELQINTEEMDDHNVDSATIDIKYEDNDYDVIAKEM